MLTRIRLEQAMPLTLAELQAEKDQLRATHAVEVRKLEVREEKLKKEVSKLTIALNRRRDELFKANEDITLKNEQIVELKSETAKRVAESEDLRNLNETLEQQLTSAHTELEDRAARIEELEGRYQAAIDDFDGQKIEIVARESRLDTAREETRKMREVARRTKDALDKQGIELKLALENADAQKKQVATQKRKVTLLQSSIADLESKLERRNNDLARLRERVGKPGAALKEAEEEIDRLHDLLAARPAPNSSQETNQGLSQDSGPDSGQTSNELQEKAAILNRVEAENKALKIELATLKLATTGGAEALEREHKALRDMVANLAAQITANVAEAQEPGSPIDEALAQESVSDIAARDVLTLADRIRAIQNQKSANTKDG